MYIDLAALDPQKIHSLLPSTVEQTSADSKITKQFSLATLDPQFCIAYEHEVLIIGYQRIIYIFFGKVLLLQTQ